MGVPTYVSAGAVQSLTTSANVPYPASVTAGNLLILHAGSADGTITNATPSGWTQLTGSPFSGGSVFQARIYYKIASGSESGTIALTATGTKGHARIEQYAPAAGETITILTQAGVTDTNADTQLSIASGTFSAATNDVIAVFGFSAGDFSAGAYNSFNITTTGFTVGGSTNTRGSGRAGTTVYQWGLQDKAITAGTSGTATNIMQGNCSSVTGLTVYVIIRSQSSGLTPGFSVKVKQSGTFVNAKLRLRSAGTWITPSSITEYHPTSGSTEQRLELPWNLQVAYTGKPAAAHYVPWYPISPNDTNPKALGGSGDEYDLAWGPTGSGSAYGGIARDRALPRAPRGASFRALDMYDEVKRMLAAKFDVCFIDYVSWSGTSTENFNNINRLFTASDQVYADTGKRLWIMPIPDGGGSATNNVSATALADTYGTWLSQAALWYYNGGPALTIPVYNPQAYTNAAYADRVAYWSSFKSRLLSQYGKTANLWMCWVSDWTSTSNGAGSSLGALAWGLSRWGDRDDVATKAANNNNRNAPAYSHSKYGKPWMHPVSPGDNRPNDTNQSAGYRWWESRGSRTLENTWMAAIDAGSDCEAVQFATWNDFAEHAHACPSPNQGFCIADLNTYWVHKWKTGSFPNIERDGVYLFHRTHPHALASFTGSQTRFGLAWGSTTAVNEVEVLVFAKAAGTAELLVNGAVTQTAAVSTGMNRINWPLPSSGVLSARVKRDGVVVPGTVATSNITLGTSRLVDDFHYRAFSSLRQYTGIA